MLIAGEFGKKIRINTAYDLSGSTDLSLAVTRPDSTQFTRTQPDLVVGTATIQAEVEQFDGATVTQTFLANEYVEYALKSGDLTTPGRYRFQLQVDFGASVRLITIERDVKVRR